VKILVLSLLAVISLTSCNTSIGLWRDTKAGFQWSKQKIQQSGGGGSGGSQEYEYGAPVY
jgi:predicted small secreted protein